MRDVLTEFFRHRLAPGLLLLALALAASGCPRSGSADVRDPGTGSGTDDQARSDGAQRPGDDARPAGGDSDDTTAEGSGVPSAGIPCARPACVYHAGVDAYFTCLNGAEGSCFHYGRSCAPEHGCMFDASSGRYRTCTESTEGRCQAWGDACEPPDRCMYDPADGLHRTCERLQDGECKRFGELCDP